MGDEYERLDGDLSFSFCLCSASERDKANANWSSSSSCSFNSSSLRDLSDFVSALLGDLAGDSTSSLLGRESLKLIIMLINVKEYLLCEKLTNCIFHSNLHKLELPFQCRTWEEYNI